MRVPSRTMSRPNRIVCPVCGSGKLQLRGLEPACCDSCGFSVEDALFRTLEQIAALPDVLGSHACECGHPEMRRLPDGVFQCPSCGSEVLPIKERKSIEWRNERRVRRGRSHKDQRGGKEVSSDRSKRS
jgi:ribosomal protein L37AE/L43A